MSTVHNFDGEGVAIGDNVYHYEGVAIGDNVYH